MPFAPFQSTMFAAPTPTAAQPGRVQQSGGSYPQAGLPAAPQLQPPQIPQQGQDADPMAQDAEANLEKQGIQSVLGTSSNSANALVQKAASAGNPVAQGLASQSTLTQPQASSDGSSLMSGLTGSIENYGANLDNSMGGQVINGIAGNAAGNGYGAQAASWLSSLLA